MVSSFFARTGIRNETHRDFVDGEEIHRANTNFGVLEVVRSKRDGTLHLLNDFVTQNDYDPVTKKGISMFSYALEGLAISYTPQVKKVLCIGLGAGLISMNFANKGVEVDAIEINPEMPRIAEKYFNADLTKIHLTIGDGREYLNRSQKKYDTVIVDAGIGATMPSHLFTQETFFQAKRILNPYGTLVINVLGWLDEGKDAFAASIEKTLRTVFQSVRIHEAGNGNLFFVASDIKNLKMSRSVSFDQVPNSARPLMRLAFSKSTSTNPDRGIILTDNFYPSEFYDAQNREAIRQQLNVILKRQVIKRGLFSDL
jgi:spermidine synthase